jgi:Family of unknown function (DUF6499)
MKAASKFWDSRPDGMRDEDYPGHHTWARARWAWEFLRRNPAYIAACEELNDRPYADEAEQTALKFGLKAFKPVWEDYSGNGVSKPRFKANRVLYYSRLKADETETYKRKLHVGELVFRIDLRDGLSDKASLDAKLRAVEKVARKIFKRFQKIQKTKAPDRRVKAADAWICLIRLLDARSSGMKPAQYASEIFKNDALTTDSSLRKEVVDPAAERAKQLAAEGYLYLVTKNLTTKPKKSKKVSPL